MRHASAPKRQAYSNVGAELAGGEGVTDVSVGGPPGPRRYRCKPPRGARYRA
jgi:hypothetical protein